MSDNYFKDFLTEKKLSQYRVAKDCGFTAATVNRWFNGYCGISNACLHRLKSVYPDFDIAKINPKLVA